MGLGVGSASIAAQLADKGIIEDQVGLCYGSFGPDVGASGEGSKNGAIIFGKIPEEAQLGLQWTPLVRRGGTRALRSLGSALACPAVTPCPAAWSCRR